MFSSFKTAAKTATLAAALGLGALAAVPAHADGVYLNYGDRADSRLGVHAGGRIEAVRDWRRDDWRRDDWRRDGWRHSCTPERALNKAQRMGLWRAHVIDVNPRAIKVAGRKYNERVVVRFGRERGCPVIYR